MIDYTVLYKCELPVEGDWPPEVRWDVFVSAFTAAERVKCVYEKVFAGSKHWLVFPEYGFAAGLYPSNAFTMVARDEAEYVEAFWESSIGDIGEKTLAIDITGFVRPYL